MNERPPLSKAIKTNWHWFIPVTIAVYTFIVLIFETTSHLCVYPDLILFRVLRSATLRLRRGTNERTNEWYDIVVVVYALRWFDLCVLWWVTMKCVDARSSVCCVCQRQFVAQSGVMLRAFVDLFDPVCFTHESSDFRWRTFWSLQFDDIHFQMIQYQMEKQCLAS